MAVVDFSSPHIDALELCRRVRAQHREPYIYILTLAPNDSQAEAVKILETGADDHISVPFDEHELRVRLRAGSRIVELQKQLIRQRERLRREANFD